MEYVIRRVREHYEIFDGSGRFVGSADSRAEAAEEIKEAQRAA